jgi:hypothetical protein
MRIHSPQFTGSVSITGSLTVSSGIINNLTSSNAITASYVANASSFPFTGSAGINGSLSIIGNLSSTSKYVLGADLSLIPISGNQSAISTWWGMQLVGNRQNNVDYTPTAIGTNSDFSVIIPNQQATKIGLIIKGQTAQTGNLLEFRDINNIGWSAFNNSGSLALGKTIANTTLDVSGNTTVTGSLIVTGSLNVIGAITAQTIVVQTITSSVAFDSGSNRFGSLLTNQHQFTGSVGITGSLTINGSPVTQGATGTQGTNGTQGTTGAGTQGTTGTQGTAATTSITNNTDNYVVTATGTGTPFNGESNLTFDGTTLTNVGGRITLSNGTSNRMTWGTNGVAAPTFTSYSAGVKMILYDSIGASSAGYTLGIESSTMYFTSDSTISGFKWYGGTTSAMTLSGTGNLSTTGTVTATNHIGPGTGLTGTASSLSIGGNAATATQALVTVTGTNSAELVRGNMADNDQFRILVGGTATNAGYVEIATADDGTEPIYVRQYTGTFTTLARTATLLDGSGNTLFPNSLSTNFTASGYHVTFRPTANATFNIGQSTGNIGTVGPFVNATILGISDVISVPLFFNASVYSWFVGYSEAMRLTSGGSLYIGSGITQNYSSWSDRKLKENLKIIANPLDKISKLTGYTFEWTKDSPYRNTPEIVNRIQDAGLIAQDVEEVLPEIVRTTKESLKTVNYDGVVALHTEGIKELIKQNQELLERIKQLEEKLL